MTGNRADAACRPVRSYAIVAASFGFLAGCLLASRLDTGLWLLVPAALCAPLFLLLRLMGRRGYAAIFLCMLALGALRAGAALHPQAPEAGTYEIEGSVYGGATLRDGERVTFTLCDITLDGKPVGGSAYCSCYINGEPPALFDGAAVKLTGRVYTPDGKSGEPRFDFRAWMYTNGMSFGIAASRGVALLNSPDNAPVKDAAYRVRSAFSRALERTMGDGSRLATAMLLSDREGMSEDENEAFRTLGIAHIMSVSGLHVGLLFGMLSAVLGAMRVPRAWRLLVTAVLLAGYCALTGFSAASVRAAVTLALLQTARIAGRKPDPLITICAAMLFVLALNPLQAYSAGFTLSFSAVAAIMLLYPVLLSAMSRVLPPRGRHAGRPKIALARRKLSRFFGTPRQLIALSVSAQLGVLVPTAVFFNSLPLYGVFVNLLAVPCAALLVPAFAVALIASPVPYVGKLTGAAASWLGDGFLWLVGLLSRLPYASVRVPSAPVAICFCAAALVVALSRRVRGGALRRFAAAALCAVIGLGGAWLSRPADTRYVQLAVGQADAALLFDHGSTVAVDVGDDGTATVDYLMHYGRDLDALILTHLHYDHVGGVRRLLESGVRVRRAYIPVNADRQQVDGKSLAMLNLLRTYEIPVETLARGDELRYADTVIRALWPVRDNVRSGQDANELPLVLAIDIGGHTLLSMSDITGDYEAYAAERCDVLKVAHHGSSESTGDYFLDYVSPKTAIISCSSGSRSLPGAALLTRLNERGIPYARTDYNGDVTIELVGDGLTVTPYKARMSE